MGLSWKLCIIVIALGHFLMAIGLTLNGVVRSRFHIPFTIQSRAPFAMFFSFVIVLIRMAVAAFWYVINSWTGAQCVNVILRAIWPQFAQVPNRLPVSANITTQMMTAYVVYFLFVLPFHWIHPRKLRWFFTIKFIVCLPAIFGMLIWACVATGGAGTENLVFRRGNTLSGSEIGWAFMSGLNVMMDNYGTLAVNINDFTRYARSSRRTYLQVFVIPASFVLMAFIGLVIFGSAERVYGELQWDVLSIMTRWNDSGTARAGAVLAAGYMAMAQVGTNLGANCVSAANDLNAMFPRYINLRRGSLPPGSSSRPTTRCSTSWTATPSGWRPSRAYCSPTSTSSIGSSTKCASYMIPTADTDSTASARTGGPLYRGAVGGSRYCRVWSLQ